MESRTCLIVRTHSKILVSLKTKCHVLPACTESNTDYLEDGSGIPLGREAMDQRIGNFLDRLIQQAKASYPEQTIIALDIDGTFNYRYSGYGMSGAKMSFFGGEQTIAKMLELQKLGAQFVGLTGAPKVAVDAIFSGWVKNFPDAGRVKGLLDSMPILSCKSTDEKGDKLWGFLAEQVGKNSDSKTLNLAFLDDSVRNAGEVEVNKLHERFAEEGQHCFTGQQISTINLDSYWLGDYTPQQQAMARKGGDFSYKRPDVTEDESRFNAIARSKCIRGEEKTTRINLNPTLDFNTTNHNSTEIENMDIEDIAPPREEAQETSICGFMIDTFFNVANVSAIGAIVVGLVLENPVVTALAAVTYASMNYRDYKQRFSSQKDKQDAENEFNPRPRNP